MLTLSLPKGFTEKKTRLTYHHLQNFTNSLQEARRDFKGVIQQPAYARGRRSRGFAGADESAEI